MRNIQLTLAYDGTDFHGWQRQTGLRTVQQVLEDGLKQLTGATHLDDRVQSNRRRRPRARAVSPLSDSFEPLDRRRSFAP